MMEVAYQTWTEQHRNIHTLPHSCIFLILHIENYPATNAEQINYLCNGIYILLFLMNEKLLLGQESIIKLL